MPEIFFIEMLGDGGKIRPSYTDYYLMAKMWGYKTCLLNEVDYQSENIYICSFKDGAADSSFSSAEAKARKCKIVLHQLEWCEWHNGELMFPEWTDGDKTYNRMGEWIWADEIWVSDHYLYNLMRRFNPKNFHRFRYVFLGGHPDFGIAPAEKVKLEIKWEAVHISYLTGMRGQKYEFMRVVNGNNFWGPNGWGDDRHQALLHARYGVNLHQGKLPVITPQRFMIFASYSLPILTDHCEDPRPYTVFQDAITHYEPSKTSVANLELAQEAVARNYDLVTRRQTFRSEVDKAVAEMLNSKPKNMVYYNLQESVSQLSRWIAEEKESEIVEIFSRLPVSAKEKLIRVLK